MIDMINTCTFVVINGVIFMIVCLSQQHLITLKEMVALSETVTVLRNNTGKLIANVWPFAQEQRSHKNLFNLRYSNLPLDVLQRDQDLVAMSKHLVVMK